MLKVVCSKGCLKSDEQYRPIETTEVSVIIVHMSYRKRKRSTNFWSPASSKKCIRVEVNEIRSCKVDEIVSRYQANIFSNVSYSWAIRTLDLHRLPKLAEFGAGFLSRLFLVICFETVTQNWLSRIVGFEESLLRMQSFQRTQLNQMPD